MSHLSPQEFVDALEGGLDTRRAAHLESCAACRTEVAALREALGEADAASPVPEPSPLFWEHFPQRVLAATADDAAGQAGFWARLWRPAALIAASAAVVALAVMMRAPEPEAPVAEQADATSVTIPALDSEADASEQAEALALIAGLASALPREELREVARPSNHAASAAIAQLTPEQQAELVRLIQAEIDGGN